LETLFHRKEGFSVHLLGTDIRTPFTWRDTIELADDVFFFGPPLDTVPCFNLAFAAGCTNRAYLNRSIESCLLK